MGTALRVVEEYLVDRLTTETHKHISFVEKDFTTTALAEIRFIEDDHNSTDPILIGRGSNLFTASLDALEGLGRLCLANRLQLILGAYRRTR